MNKQDMKIAIIGAGPLGIAAGHELLKQGFKNFSIFEKEQKPGGTWHMQTYPGLACDVWAHSYTYSYAPNPNWSASFVNQPEIEAYIQQCASEFGLNDYIHLNRRIISAHWLDSFCWQLTFDDQQSENFDVVINAMGSQHTPLFPNLKNADAFAGESWHSTHWRHDIDLQGKRVIVIGSAAAAVQIVPEIAPKVAHLTVIQRTANWIVPRNQRIYPAWQKSLFKRFPAAMRLLRNIQGLMMNFVHQAAIMDSKRMTLFENMGKKFIAKAIDDPSLQTKLIPDSRYACKRPLVSDDFYPALNRDNVELVHAGAEEITATGLITSDGRAINGDIIIYCTGYKVMDFDRIEVKGLNNKVLAAQMAEAPQAYKGIAAPNFPNYFFGAGPNALVLSVSYFKSIESNVHCIVNLLAEMCTQNVRAIDVNINNHKGYNDWIVDNCKRFSWGSGTCHNYYTNAAGHSPFLYPDDYQSFLAMRSDCGLDKFVTIAKT